MEAELRCTVAGVVHTIEQWHQLKVEWTNTFQAPDVVTVLIWKGSALMVRVDSTDRTKVVLGYFGIELVKRKSCFALNNFYTRKQN